jgi:putative ABC transport system permease protein
MSLLQTMVGGLRSLFRKKRVEKELDDELRGFLDMAAEEKMKQGMSREEALRNVRLERGSLEVSREVVRTAAWESIVETSWQDLRYAARMLRKSPGFTSVAILTLALGIGANTAIFSVVQGVLLAPLPYHEPDRLLTVWLNNFHLNSPTYLSYRDFMDWEHAAPPFEKMSAFARRSFDLSSPGNPEHLEGSEISSSFLSTLGVRLALGREFSAEEDRNGGAPVAIISNGLWRDRFGGNASALGKSAVLNGVETTIVGVLQPGFRFGTDYADVYIPIGQRKLVDANDRTVHDVVCIARLKRGGSVTQADAEMNAIQENIDRLNPETEQGLGIKILSAKEPLVGDVRGTLLLLLGAVGVVLLIACANVANLLLARSAARAREFSIRAALGAGRGRIVRQLITESVLLSILGGVLGLAAAKWGLSTALATLAADLPRGDNIHLNASVLFFALGLSLGVGILFGLAPALRSSKADLQPSLKEGDRGSTGRHHRTQSALVVVQIALTLVLLAGAGLLFRTIQHLWKADLGFESQHVLTFQVGLSPSAIKTGADVRSAYQQLLDRIRQVPGVQGAEITTEVPMTHQMNAIPFWIDSHRPASVAEAPRTLGFITGPDFLQVMHIPLIRGRFINQQDTVNSPLVAVIDTELARTYFPDKDPIGRTITFPQVGDYRIIGVVGHVQHWQVGLSSPFMQNQSYVSIYQIQDRWMTTIDTWTWVVLRTPLEASMVLPEIRKAVHAVGSDQTIYHAQTMLEIVSESMAPQRFPLILLGSFATLALLLASIGIYGVISYSVTQRVHEIGIRLALGAEKRDVFRMVVGQGLTLAFAGLAIGVTAALILTRLLLSFSSLLYGVGASDPVTLASVSAVLIGVAIVACCLPARRAMRVDPIVALRYE